MSEWTGETEAGRGGGYDYQWTVAALLAVNYLKARSGGPFLPLPVHGSIGPVDTVFLEWAERGPEGELVERQDVTLQSGDIYFQVQIKRSKSIWTPAELRAIMEHLRDHKKSTSDFLIFVSDRDIHNDFSCLRRELRSEAELQALMDWVTKRRKRSKTDVPGKKLKPVKVLIRDDLHQMFFQQLGDQCVIEWQLRELLASFMPANRDTVALVVDQFKKWSITKGGKSLTIQELDEFLNRSLSRDFPVQNWLTDSNCELLTNLVDVRRDSRSALVVDAPYALLTLGLLLTRPMSVLSSEESRLGLLLAQFAACFPDPELWENLAAGIGLCGDLVKRAYRLAHNGDRSSGLPNSKVIDAWPGQKLHCFFQLAQRLNWHKLGLYGILPTTSRLYHRQIHWRCFFLHDIQFNALSTRFVNVVLGFPSGFDEGARSAVVDCWRREMNDLTQEFNKCASPSSSFVLFEVSTAHPEAPLASLDDGSLEELQQMLGPLNPSLVTEIELREVPAPAMPVTVASEGSVIPDTPEGWQTRAERLELEGSLAQAKGCWSKASEQFFNAGDQLAGFTAYVAMVRLLQLGCWSPIRARLPDGAELEALAASGDAALHLKVVQALAWGAFGELRLLESMRLLQQAPNRFDLDVALQLARMHILEQQTGEASQVLLRAVAQVDELESQASQFVKLAAELYCNELFDNVVKKVSSVASASAEFRLAVADFYGRKLDFRKSHEAYQQLQGETLEPGFLALACDNDPFFGWKCGYLFSGGQDLEGQRIDHQRARTSQAYEWLQRAQGSYAAADWRSTLQELLLSLDAAMVEGNWVARQSAYRLLARLYLKTEEDPVTGMRCAVIACDSDLIRESAVLVHRTAEASRTTALVRELLDWRQVSCEFPFCLEALGALSDLLSDDDLAAAWERGFLAPKTRQDVWSSSKLLSQLGARVSPENAAPTVDMLIEQLEVIPQEDRLEALVDSLVAIVKEYPERFADEWERPVAALTEQWKRPQKGASHYPTHCRQALLEILKLAPAALRDQALPELVTPRLDLSALQAEVGGLMDAGTAWTLAQQYLDIRPDPVESKGGYLRMTATGGPAPADALDLLPSLTPEQQHKVLVSLCDIILEHDCLPIRRGGALGALSQLSPHFLALDPEMLATVAILTLEGDFVKGAWSKQVTQRVSVFSAVRTNYGPFTIIDRGATCLLGALYPLLTGDLKKAAIGHLVRATGSSDAYIRQGVATALWTIADRVDLDEALVLLLGALVKDEDQAVAGFSVRAVSLQVARRRCLHQDLLITLTLSRLCNSSLRPALAKAVATMLRYRPELLPQLDEARKSLAADVSFRVRKRLSQPDTGE